MSRSVEQYGTFVRFESGETNLQSEVFGPFDFVQMAGDVLRVSVDSEVDNGQLAMASVDPNGNWECNGDRWTDVVIFHGAREAGKEVVLPDDVREEYAGLVAEHQEKASGEGMEKFYNDRRVRVFRDGKWETTHLLHSWVSDLGVAISVSGPETLLLNEVEVRELDGSELNLDKGAHDIMGNEVRS